MHIAFWVCLLIAVRSAAKTVDAYDKAIVHDKNARGATDSLNSFEKRKKTILSDNA
jgi:hypothetical protein